MGPHGYRLICRGSRASCSTGHIDRTQCRDGLREARVDMDFAERRWMREAMAEQSAELASLRADNRSLRAEVARLSGNGDA